MSQMTKGSGNSDQRWCNREGDVCATRRVFVWMVSFISYNAFRYIVAIFCCLLNLQLFFLNSCSQRGNNLDMLYNKNALSSLLSDTRPAVEEPTMQE